VIDWQRWHTSYDDPRSPLSQRLVEVRRQVRLALDRSVPGAIRLLSLCAGDGRDDTSACAGAAPADLLLMCGIFGNVGDDDVERTVSAVPSLLATGGTVIWTRSTRAPDLIPRIRSWFEEVGVEEVSFAAAPAPGWSVGAGVHRGPTAPFVAGRRLFAFR